MKLFLAFLFLGIGITYAALQFKHYPDKLKKLQREWHDACLVHSDTTEELVEGFRHGKFPNDLSLKNYVLCFYKYSGVLTKDGKIDFDILEQYEPPQWTGKFRKIVGDCFEKFTDKADMTERLYETEKCVHDVDPENFLMT